MNLSALRRFYPAYADVFSLAPNGGAYRFGPIGSVVGCRDSMGRWIHGPDDPWSAAIKYAEKIVGEDPEIYIVVRPGIGYQAFAILEAMKQRCSRSLLLVVEDRLDLLNVAFGIVDWTELIDSADAVLLFGKPAETVEAFFELHPTLALLPATIVAPAEVTDEAAYGSFAERLSTRSAEVRAGLEGALGATAEILEDRRNNRRPPRVVLAGDGYGYLAEPVAVGFRNCGCDVIAPSGHEPHARGVRRHRWISRIAHLQPDVVLWMNQPELSHMASDALRQLGVANVVWAVDDPRRMKLSTADFRMVDLYASFDGRHLQEYEARGAKASMRLSLAAGIRPLVGCSPSDAVWPTRLGPDVCFVGSLGEARIAEFRSFLQSRHPERLALLDELAADTADPALTFERRTGRKYEGMSCVYVEEVRSTKRRLEILSRMQRWSLRIFGGADWTSAGSQLAACYSGRSLLYGPDLSGVYYHAKINLNVFHDQCVDATNSRVYDVLAAGGFLLTEQNAALRREFEAGRHLVTFSSASDAAEKVEHYLNHESERESIAREGQRHVLANHTFDRRCKDLLDRASTFVRSPR